MLLSIIWKSVSYSCFFIPVTADAAELHLEKFQLQLLLSPESPVSETPAPKVYKEHLIQPEVGQKLR
jgi:hypothetical protein